MKRPYVYSVSEYYARINAYEEKYGLGVDEKPDWDLEALELEKILGPAKGRAVLDCSCGWGAQAVALAKSGWQVTATDISESNMALARRDVLQEGLTVKFRVCDMRNLGEFFRNEFDWAVSFNALYELVDDKEIHVALRGIYTALKPGGGAAFRLRDMDFLVDEEMPRHRVRREWKIPNGRIITMNDWEYLSDDAVIAYDVFLREDETVALGVFGRWVSETIGVVRKILRKNHIETFLKEAGFSSIKFLLPPHPWDEYKVVAVKPA